MRPSLLLAAVVLLLSPLPSQAQSSRYPTDAEIDRLLQEMRREIPNLLNSGFYSDRRTPQQRQQRDALVERWTAVDGAIAPFLGDWAAIEENLVIFPAPTRGEVCIIDHYLDEADFYMGRVVDGKLYTANNLVVVLDSGFLVSTYVYDGQPGDYEYANPRLPENPIPSRYYAEYHPDIVEQFRQAGCVGAP